MAKLNRIAIAATVLIATIFVGTLPASAATNPLVISVTETKVTPSSDGQSFAVAVTGEVSNNSTTGLSNIQVTLGSKAKITSRDALHTFLSDPTKTKLTSSTFSTTVNKLPGNAKQTWQLTFNAENIFPTPSGVYGFGVTAAASSATASDLFALTLQSDTTTKVGTVVAVQLTTLNAHLANGVKTANDAAELTRLTNIILDAKDLPVSWIVDPALKQWLADLTKSELSNQASALTGLLDAVAANSTPSVYGQPDVARMLASSRDADLSDLVSRTQELSKSQKIVYPSANGVTSNSAILGLADRGVAPILNNDQFGGKITKTVNAYTSVKTAPALVSDLGLSNCFIKTGDTAVSLFKQGNCLQNDLALISQELVPTVLVITPINWAPAKSDLPALMAAVISSPLAITKSLNELLNEAPIGNQKMPADIKVKSFAKTLIKTGDELLLSSNKIGTLFVDPNYNDDFALVRLRGFSALWPTGDLAEAFLVDNQDVLTQYQNAIAIDASHTITVSTASSQIPVTVVNNSDRDVSVVVQLTSPMTSRFSSQPSAAVTIPSGKRVTVPMSINVTGKGILNITATLYTQGGQPVGKSKLIQISSAEYQGFARTLVVVAFGLLLLLSISNLVKRKREAS